MSEYEWLCTFSNKLRIFLYEWGYTQKDLAVLTDISESAISDYINRRKMPGVRSLINIAEVLDVSLDELMYFGDRIQ